MPDKKSGKEVLNRKSHKLRNWMIGLSLLAGAGLVGDAYLQESKYDFKIGLDYKIGYQLGAGYTQLYNQAKDEAARLFDRGAAELERRVADTKESIKYDKYNLLYDMGFGAAAGAIATYLLMRKKEKK